jgi:hypothetical protein
VSEVQSIDRDARICEDYIRRDNTVEILRQQIETNISSTVNDGSGELENDILTEVERLNNIASLHAKEPLIEFRKICALKCIAYRRLEQDDQRACSTGRDCNEFTKWMLSYAGVIGVDLASSDNQSSLYPLFMKSSKDSVWHSVYSGQNRCMFLEPGQTDIAVSFYHPDEEYKVELRHSGKTSALVQHTCQDGSCDYEAEQLKFVIMKDLIKIHGKEQDTGKFILYSELKNGKAIRFKVDDCVAELTLENGSKESLFPRDDISCLHLEKVKQYLLHVL